MLHRSHNLMNLIVSWTACYGVQQLEVLHVLWLGFRGAFGANVAEQELKVLIAFIGEGQNFTVLLTCSREEAIDKARRVEADRVPWNGCFPFIVLSPDDALM